MHHLGYSHHMNDKSRGLLQIHAAVFLFGFIGLFGKWIALPASVIVAGRVCVAAAILLAIILVKHAPILPARRKDLGLMALLGLIMAGHWVMFFVCVQMASVAIAVLTFATAPVFAGVMEPLFTREKISLKNVLLSLLCLAGVAILLPHFDLHAGATIGTLWGLASGFGFAVLSILNRHALKSTGPLNLMFWQCAIAAVAMLPVLLTAQVHPRPLDIGLIVLLGAVFTALAHGLFVGGMRWVNAHTATVLVSLEPLYAIALAWMLLGEAAGWKTLVGGAMILLSAFLVTQEKPESP